MKQDLFTQQFYNMDDTLKPYAFKILEKLCLNTETGFNIIQIYNGLENRNITLIRKVLAQLDRIYLIKILKSNCDKSEKRYFITDSGKQLIINHYSSISK